jgi:LmbE family N-acetylglucosaminyl deacetylase
MKIFNSRKTRIGRHVFLATLAIASIITAPRAQQPAPVASKQSPDDRVALYQALLDLTNPWTVMCIAAHPDDEDGTSLIVMRRKYGAHTVSLFSTFGEGGQNAIGPELYEELGAIRARETMAAAEIQGSEPHFLGLKDFGYSKTRDEAFKFWGHEEGLRRMVLEIRKLRPDVIITNHSTTSNDHGQHQATALMVVEAFDAAADPTKFPEQLKDGVTTWQVQRLFVRARGNQTATNQATIVTIDPNERDPIRGVVYAEEALRALQKHATQGPWPKSFAEYATRFRAFSGQQGGAPGQLPLIRYALVREAKGATPKESHNFLDGLRLPDAEAVLVAAPQIEGKPLTDYADKPAAVLAELSASSVETSKQHGAAIANQPRALAMRNRIYLAMGAASGIIVSIAPKGVLAPGTMTDVVITVSNNGTLSTQLGRLDFDGKPVAAEPGFQSLSAGERRTFVVHYSTPKNAQLSVPHAEHLYDGGEFGTRLKAVAAFSIVHDSHQFVVPSETNIDVAPAIEIKSVDPKPLVITPVTAAQSHGLTVTLVNHQLKPFEGSITVGSETFPAALLPQEEKSFPLVLRRLPSNVGKLRIATKPAISQEEALSVVFPAVRVTPRLNIGYIRGFDFSLPNALNALGVESKELSVDEVKTSVLSKFTSIIVDNRVYESQPELIAVNQKLLDYANAGGNLIVFYHKSDEWNPNPGRNRPQLAPYKLILGNERITDENAPITFIEPDHPLLNVPNKMGQDDFKDWIQERGLYYPREWDPQFHALLQSNDPGEAPLKGGLLVADYGRGHYIYTSMVWYRELRAGVPGAYRMLANMISYGRN